MANSFADFIIDTSEFEYPRRTAVRQSFDQFAAGREQMARDIAKLQAAKQGILDKISAPPPRPAGAAAR